MNSQIIEFKKTLSGKQGIAVDIDETLSNTIGWWFTEMIRLFGNPEDLTAMQIVEKYRHSSNVPYWQTDEAKRWMHEQRFSDDLQAKFEIFREADKFLKEVEKIIPIRAYITVRPDGVRNGTQKWLSQHNFPKAELIMRPDNVTVGDSNKWKADVLAVFYPEIEGIVDDNPGILKSLPSTYKGKVWIYNKEKLDFETNINHIFCPTWADVVANLKQIA